VRTLKEQYNVEMAVNQHQNGILFTSADVNGTPEGKKSNYHGIDSIREHLNVDHGILDTLTSSKGAHNHQITASNFNQSNVAGTFRSGALHGGHHLA